MQEGTFPTPPQSVIVCWTVRWAEGIFPPFCSSKAAGLRRASIKGRRRESRNKLQRKHYLKDQYEMLDNVITTPHPYCQTPRPSDTHVFDWLERFAGTSRLSDSTVVFSWTHYGGTKSSVHPPRGNNSPAVAKYRWSAHTQTVWFWNHACSWWTVWDSLLYVYVKYTTS